ncbi:MAG: thiamine-binding protein [Phaeodactylibacter sp.]|nr:thiamine-binding protein [Phaeodactylibacter sp.]MCB9265509.1 thiamine-binding protein [Lewinellaceae bacterium]MCB9289557.1 thiamine-binding protein [Lewinellaceae bacterium]
MKASAEISMYPLDKDYEGYILDFIARIRLHEGLQVEVNSLSTQIFGDYDTIMNALHQEIKLSFNQGVTASMVIKVLNVEGR